VDPFEIALEEYLSGKVLIMKIPIKIFPNLKRRTLHTLEHPLIMYKIKETNYLGQ
jgi:hypothetical protein